MFGEKSQRIEELTAQNDQLQRELDGVAPYIEIAKQIRHEVNDFITLTEEMQGSGTGYDVTGKPVLDEIYQLSVRNVRERCIDEVRSRVADEIGGQILDQEVQKLEVEIREKEGPSMVDAAKEKFEAEKEEQGAKIRAKIEEELTTKTREELLISLEDEIRLKMEKEAAEKELAKQKAEQKELDRLALIEAEKQSELKRVSDILDDNKRGIFNLKKVKVGEQFKLSFVYRGEREFAVKNLVRHMRFEMEDPCTGKVMVLNDSWSDCGDVLKETFAIEDGLVLEIGTETKVNGQDICERDLRRGFRMYIDVSKFGEAFDALDISSVSLGDLGNVNHEYATKDRYGNSQKWDLDIFDWRENYDDGEYFYKGMPGSK